MKKAGPALALPLRNLRYIDAGQGRAVQGRARVVFVAEASWKLWWPSSWPILKVI